MMTVLSVVGWILLWILIVIFGLLALIVLLLSVPVWVMADYGDETRLTVRYGLIPIRILPSKPKDPAKQKEKKPKQPKPKPEKSDEPKPKKTLEEILGPYGGLDHLPETMPELLGALLEVGKMLNGFRNSLTICYLRVVIVCGGDDAAQAAINYGRAWPILIAIEQALGKVLRLKKFEGDAQLDYAESKQKFLGTAKLRIVPMRLVGVAVHRALKMLRRYFRIRKYGKPYRKAHKQANKTKKGVTFFV